MELSTTPGFYLNISEALKMFVVVVSTLFLHRVVSEDVRDLYTYPMEYYCGKILNLDDYGNFQVVIEFQPDNVVLTGDSCNVTLNAGYHKMAVRVVYFKDNGVVCRRRLEMFQLAIDNPDVENKKPSKTVCNDPYLYSDTFFTNTSLLLLKYFYRANQPGGTFRLVVTLFHTGQCLSDEVRCVNGHCIKHSIYCNDHNPCGDDSERCADETKPVHDSVTSIVLAIVVTVLVLVILGGTLYGCCCKNRRFRNAGSSGTQGPSRFWFDVFTSRGTTTSRGETNEGANFDNEPPDYNSLDTTSSPPLYDDVIHDTIKYKVSDQTIHYI